MIIRGQKKSYRAGARWKGSEGKALRKRAVEVGKHWEEGGHRADNMSFFFYPNITALFILRSNQLQLQNRYAKNRL